MVYLTSDLHFCHNREFLYTPRGFNSIEEHDEEIIKRWNSIVSKDDDVYVLGDLMLNDNEKGIENLRKLNGRIHIILGNHDTDTRIELYKKLTFTYQLFDDEHLDPITMRIEDIKYADVIKYNGYHFYLSHYPTMTANLEKEDLKHCMINLYGHTHQKTNFYNDIPFMYHVGLDSHDCYPVSLDQIIEDCKAKVKECKNML